jgi:ribosomal protein S5
MANGTRLGAATVHHLTLARMDAGGTRLRLRALHVMGHGSARIGRALGVREAAEASSAATARHPEPGPAADREAGQ